MGAVGVELFLGLALPSNVVSTSDADAIGEDRPSDTLIAPIPKFPLIERSYCGPWLNGPTTLVHPQGGLWGRAEVAVTWGGRAQISGRVRETSRRSRPRIRGRVRGRWGGATGGRQN